MLKTPWDLQWGKIDVLRSETSEHIEWSVKGKSVDKRNNALIWSTYGTKRRSAYSLFEDALNLRDARVYDTVYENGKEKRVLNQKETMIAQQKQDAICEAFRNWIFKDPQRRADLCATYNRQHLRTGIELQKIAAPLLRQMVGDYKKGFLIQPQPFALHAGGDHFKGLARADTVGQQRVPTVQHPGHGVALVGFQLVLRVHSGEPDVIPVVLTGPDRVEQAVEKWSIKQMEKTMLNLTATLEKLNDKPKARPYSGTFQTYRWIFEPHSD